MKAAWERGGRSFEGGARGRFGVVPLGEKGGKAREKGESQERRGGPPQEHLVLSLGGITQEGVRPDQKRTFGVGGFLSCSDGGKFLL